MRLFGDIVREYYCGPNKRLRFGQFFVNRYVKASQLPWPELFYCEDTEQSMEMARDFLIKGVKRYE